MPVERQANLSTTVPIGLSLAGVTQDNDLAIINFNAGGLEVIEGDELAKALAQIVWTLTETGDLDSIIISIEGEIKTWPTPNSGDQQLLRRIQFMSYAPEVTLGIWARNLESLIHKTKKDKLKMEVILSIDAGTTGVRSMLVDKQGSIVESAYREFSQYFPQDGYVEHNPLEIWEAIEDTIAEVIQRFGSQPVAIDITNQRETIVCWDKKSSLPQCNALVWQDRRTSRGAHNY